MKALIYEGPEQIVRREIPKPVAEEGWAMVKVAYAGICGTDLNIYGGGHPRAKAPLVMGHEFSGTLESDNVPGIPKGSRVTVDPLLSCGHCTPCLEGNAHVCNTLGLIGIDCDGGFAEYVKVPADKVVALPDELSDKMGAFVEPLAVTVHALRENNFKPGDNALVFGCGNIGLSTALTLRQFGASSIVMAEMDPVRAGLAKSMGFTVVDPTQCDIVEEAKARTGGNGFDWVLDCAGVQSVADVLLDVVKVHGKIVIVAAYKKPCTMPFFQGMVKEAEILFTRVYRLKDFQLACELAMKDPDYEKIITTVLPIEEAQKGFDLLTTKGSGAIKVMLKI